MPPGKKSSDVVSLTPGQTPLPPPQGDCSQFGMSNDEKIATWNKFNVLLSSEGAKLTVTDGLARARLSLGTANRHKSEDFPDLSANRYRFGQLGGSYETQRCRMKDGVCHHW